MSSFPDHDSRFLPWYQRLALAAAGAGLLALLFTAATLQPDHRGYGTHQQLGLPPCTFGELVGIRCPSCGMTTSWAHLLRGQIIRSLQANVGGTLLAVIAALVGPWALVCGLRGRRLSWTPGAGAAVAVSVMVIVVTLVDWGVRLLLGY